MLGPISVSAPATPGALGLMARASASPLPENRLPSAGDRCPSRPRFLSSSRLDPSVPAARTRSGASTVPRAFPSRSRKLTRHRPPARSGGAILRTSWSGAPPPLVERVHPRAVSFGARDVGDVNRVLREHGTADVAPAEVLTALLQDAAERMAAVSAEVPRQRQPLRRAAGAGAHRVERVDLAQGVLRRRLLRGERLLGTGVVRVELRAGDRGRPRSLLELRRRRPELHVGVHE